MKRETKIFLENYFIEMIDSLNKFIERNEITSIHLPSFESNNPIYLYGRTSFDVYWRDFIIDKEQFHIWIETSKGDLRMNFELPEALDDHHKIYILLGIIIKRLINNKLSNLFELPNQTFKRSLQYLEKECRKEEYK